MGQASAVPPEWSVFVPTYEPTELLRETLESALAAASRADRTVRIEVVDDASPTIDVASLLRKWRIDLPVVERETNGGLGRCWNSCIERAGGSLIHLLHQDDLVKPDFYRRMSALADAQPSAGMYFCRTELLQDGKVVGYSESEPGRNGLAEGWLAKICERQRLFCPSVVVRASSYDRLGGFDDGLRYVVDWEMWVRLAAHYGVGCTDEPLAAYRDHGGSETSRIKAGGQVTADFGRALKLIHKTLASVGRLDCYRLAEGFAETCAVTAVVQAERRGDRATAVRELFASMNLPGGIDWVRFPGKLRWLLKLCLGMQGR